MNIVFYNTNTNIFDGTSFCITEFPSPLEKWTELCNKYPQHNFFAAVNLPGMFLSSYKDSNLTVNNKVLPDNLKFILLPAGTKNATVQMEEEVIDKIVNTILELNPQWAIASSYWNSPYDWLNCQDALIASRLKAHGIKTLCTDIKKSLICFDKARTKDFLEYNGFNTPNSVYIHHDLFFKTSRSINANTYRQCVLHQVQELQYPVIIKDTTGSSSVGLDVLHNYEQVRDYLFSKRNNSDRLVEEFLEGPQFGLELRGLNNNYTVLPPFMFSVNRYGITSPKQSVKAGPVMSQLFNIQELNSQMQHLAELLELNGSAQVDLVFSKGKWYIIEINPRLSGMTNTYQESLGYSILQSLAYMALEGKPMEAESIKTKKIQCSLNIKLPLLDNSKLEEIKNFPGINYLCQTENKAATQHRERGYTEIIITADDFEGIKKILNELNKKHPDAMEAAFLENAERLLNQINN